MINDHNKGFITTMFYTKGAEGAMVLVSGADSGTYPAWLLPVDRATVGTCHIYSKICYMISIHQLYLQVLKSFASPPLRVSSTDTRTSYPQSSAKQ